MRAGHDGRMINYEWPYANLLNPIYNYSQLNNFFYQLTLFLQVEKKVFVMRLAILNTLVALSKSM